MQNEVDWNDQFLKANLDIDLRLIEVKSDPYVNARMRTAMDLNESGIDLNECEHFLKANFARSQTSWIDLNIVWIASKIASRNVCYQRLSTHVSTHDVTQHSEMRLQYSHHAR